MSPRPGSLHIPVCSPERAWRSWDKAKKGGTDYYPKFVQISGIRSQRGIARSNVEDVASLYSNRLIRLSKIGFRYL
jgi:hypothetical protein